MEKTTINILLEDYKNAPEGSLLIKKGGKWVCITKEELLKDKYSNQSDIKSLGLQIESLAKNQKHYKLYSKSHFLVIYNFYISNVAIGKIPEQNGAFEIFGKVLKDEIKIEDAISELGLTAIFNEFFGNNKDVYKEI